MEPTYKRFGSRMAMALVLVVVALVSMTMARDQRRDGDGQRAPDTLYVWAGDQARVAPDFLAVIDFDEDSPRYGKVIRTVPVPGPGSAGNEPHHCHLSADKNILACGGLLALLRGQNSIFFFDVSRPRQPRFLFSTSGTLSNITDDFLPLNNGGFLVTQMGDHAGGTPGHHRVDVAGVSVDGDRVVHRWLGAVCRDVGGRGRGRLAAVIDDSRVSEAGRVRRQA